MKHLNNKGFTLIELLVVVLIIGILAAIAVPQYQKATYKAIDTKIRLALRDITHAQKLYYDTTGTYAGSGEEDKIDAPYPVQENGFYISSDLTCRLASSGGPIIKCTHSNPLFYIYYYIYTKSPHILCIPFISDHYKGEPFCQFITRTATKSTAVNHQYSAIMTLL